MDIDSRTWERIKELSGDFRYLNAIRILPFSIVLMSIAILAPAAHASGGYDHGTSTGKGKVQIDLTWNPANSIESGQSYVVVGIGLTKNFDLHGYFSHEATGVNQFYYGAFYQFLRTRHLDLSTAVGLRHRRSARDLFFPQLLYNLKFDREGRYSIGGSVVSVRRLVQEDGSKGPSHLGVTYDIAFFFPLSKNIQLGIGAFRGVSGNVYPTYSLDIKTGELF